MAVWVLFYEFRGVEARSPFSPHTFRKLHGPTGLYNKCVLRFHDISRMLFIYSHHLEGHFIIPLK